MASHLRGAGYFLALVLVAFLNFGPGWTARNGSGTYSTVNSFTAGTTITASSFNENFTDIANEITNSVAADGQTTMTGPLKAASGTAAAPGYTFGADTDTGFYRKAANEIGISVAGTEVGSFTSAGLVSIGVPIGTVFPYAGSSAPTGYLLCNGAAVSRTTYAALFTILATNFGVGDGSTTFNVPDCTGRAVYGKESVATRLTAGVGGVNGASLGSAGGAQSVTLARANLPNVTLDLSGVVGSALRGVSGAASTANVSSGAGISLYPSDQFSTVTIDLTGGLTSSINGGVGQTDVNKLPPAIVLNYIIRH